ncbi:MAG: hypothetical protein MUD16_01430 [Desulfobacterales bacterium]|jgi:hypothetical protein|nr:hypothetical protein [Desulfobacterales bacterium]
MAILAALVILVLITIIGISASQVANTEAAMSRNAILYHRNFYLAEGAAIEAIDELENIANLKSGMPVWVDTLTGELTVENVREYFKDPSVRNTLLTSSTTPFHNSHIDPVRAQYVAGVEGIAPGESLDPDKPKIHNLSIYGRCEWDGVSIVRVGYRAAY